MKSKRPDSRWIHNAVVVSGSEPKPYVLTVGYFESDPLSCTTHVLRFDTGPEGEQELALGCNDPLSALWVSPGGIVWAASSDGKMWTTGPGPGEAPPEAAFRSDTADLAWRRMELPLLRENSLPPNVVSLWGAGEDLLYAATYSGAVYRWGGARWEQMEGSAPAALIRIHGRGDRVYAAGMRGGVITLRGGRWERVPLAAGSEFTVCRGVCVTENAVYLCTRSGDLLVERNGRFEPIAHVDAQLTAIVQLDFRLLLTSVPAGVLEWIEGKLVELKGGFNPIDAYTVGDRAFFIEGDQVPYPKVAEYSPKADKVWTRRAFPMEDS